MGAFSISHVFLTLGQLTFSNRLPPLLDHYADFTPISEALKLQDWTMTDWILAHGSRRLELRNMFTFCSVSLLKSRLSKRFDWWCQAGISLVASAATLGEGVICHPIQRSADAAAVSNSRCAQL